MIDLFQLISPGMIENPQVRKVLNEVVSGPKGWLVHCIGITGRIASFASSVVSFDALALVVDHKKAILACTAQH